MACRSVELINRLRSLSNKASTLLVPSRAESTTGNATSRSSPAPNANLKAHFVETDEVSVWLLLFPFPRDEGRYHCPSYCRWPRSGSDSAEDSGPGWPGGLWATRSRNRLCTAQPTPGNGRGAQPESDTQPGRASSYSFQEPRETLTVPVHVPLARCTFGRLLPLFCSLLANTILPQGRTRSFSLNLRLWTECPPRTGLRGKLFAQH